MKPIPGTLQGAGASFQTTHWALILSARALAAKASFVDSSEHADRDFVFTRGREMDINETAVAEEFTK